MARTDRKFWGGMAISLFFLALLFRKMDAAQLADAFRTMNVVWLVPAVLLTFASYYGRAIRWKFLLLPLKRCRMANLYPATIIGYMANNLLPARLGEFVRAFVLADRERLDKAAVFATLVMDRLLDGFSLLVILLITLFTIRFPDGGKMGGTLATGGYITLVIYLCAVLFLVFLRKRTEATLRLTESLLSPLPKRVSEKLMPLLGSFIHGIRLPQKARHWGALFLSSFFIWLFAIIPIDLVLRSFGVELPFSASLFIMVLLLFAVMVPASPGYIGTYHYACFRALTAFGVSDGRAVSIALIIHAVSFFPVIIAGFYHLWRSKTSFRSIRAESSTQVAAEPHA